MAASWVGVRTVLSQKNSSLRKKKVLFKETKNWSTMNSFLGGFRFDCDMTAPNFERTKPSVWELGFSAFKKGKTESKRRL